MHRKRAARAETVVRWLSCENFFTPSLAPTTSRIPLKNKAPCHLKAAFQRTANRLLADIGTQVATFMCVASLPTSAVIRDGVSINA
jgi:hypothetical protein